MTSRLVSPLGERRRKRTAIGLRSGFCYFSKFGFAVEMS
jgi:hypothetical protein